MDIICIHGCEGETMVKKDPEVKESWPLWFMGHFLLWLKGVRVSGLGRRKGKELAGE